MMEIGQVRELFRRHGLRWTRQRELLYAELARCDLDHPTAEELLNSARIKDPGLSLATVYNSLEAFSESGLCRRLSSVEASGPCRFDVHTHDHAHVLTADGRVMDLPGDLSRRLMDSIPPDILTEVERSTGIRVDRVSMQFIARSGGHCGAALPAEPVFRSAR